jgi:hypothetical protein
MLVFVLHVKPGGLIALCASLCCLGPRVNHQSKKFVTFLELFLRDFVFLLNFNHYIEFKVHGTVHR